jgi:hypothetical protein
MSIGDVLEFRGKYARWTGTYLGFGRVRLFRVDRRSDGVCAVCIEGYVIRRSVLGIKIYRKTDT